MTGFTLALLTIQMLLMPGITFATDKSENVAPKSSRTHCEYAAVRYNMRPHDQKDYFREIKPHISSPDEITRWYRANRHYGKQPTRPPTYAFTAGCPKKNRSGAAETSHRTFYARATIRRDSYGEVKLFASVTPKPNRTQSVKAAKEKIVKSCGELFNHHYCKSQEFAARITYTKEKFESTPPTCQLWSITELGWESGHKTRFCKARGYEGLVVLEGAPYRDGGMCYVGNCPKTTPW